MAAKRKTTGKGNAKKSAKKVTKTAKPRNKMSTHKNALSKSKSKVGTPKQSAIVVKKQSAKKVTIKQEANTKKLPIKKVTIKKEANTKKQPIKKVTIKREANTKKQPIKKVIIKQEPTSAASPKRSMPPIVVKKEPVSRKTKPLKGGKKVKEEKPTSLIQKTIEMLKESSSKPKIHKVDSECRLNGISVYQDYDCMLNQTNIGFNNNKYYVIQLLHIHNRCYYVWNRWGRVGESGMHKVHGPFTQLALAEKEFKKKFHDKTKNHWDQRDNFEPVTKKYTMIDVSGEECEELFEKPVSLKRNYTYDPSALDGQTQKLLKLIFDKDMFNFALKTFNIDTKKMPLGKLSKIQIAKGFEALEEIEHALTKNRGQLSTLSSKFYTVIPHNFGRYVPPVISQEPALREKYDMLMVLADIEAAQTLEKTQEDKISKSGKIHLPHPLDDKLDMLNCEMKILDKNSKTFKIIDNYVNKTSYRGFGNPPQLLDAWSIKRQPQEARFKKFQNIKNRKLLWHGTNVAVVAAILKSGLRIMPHSGGRVGKGIYFASENAKSAGYVGRAPDGTGIMFLNEVALGKEHEIVVDNHTLVQAPSGYDSIIARGTTEPNPKEDIFLEIEGKKVIVPQGNPINQSKFNTSNFSQSEYLIYNEGQNMIRYMLRLKFR